MSFVTPTRLVVLSLASLALLAVALAPALAIQIAVRGGLLAVGVAIVYALRDHS